MTTAEVVDAALEQALRETDPDPARTEWARAEVAYADAVVRAKRGVGIWSSAPWGWS